MNTKGSAGDQGDMKTPSPISTTVSYASDGTFQLTVNGSDPTVPSRELRCPVFPFSHGAWSLDCVDIVSEEGKPYLMMLLRWTNRGVAVQCGVRREVFEIWDAETAQKLVRRVVTPTSGLPREFPSSGEGEYHIAAFSRTDIGQPEKDRFTIQISVSNISIATSPLSHAPQISQLTSYLFDNAQPNDVCLHFPNNRIIFACSKLLSKSPYFSKIISSEFLEGQKRSIMEYKSGEETSQENQRKRKASELDPQDSDEDGTPVEGKPEDDSEHRDLLGLYYHVKVTETTYKTYRGILHWLYTDSITFSNLQSTSLFPSKTPPPSRTRSASPPNSVSSKSVYRLSHFLELPELSVLALADFKS